MGSFFISLICRLINGPHISEAIHKECDFHFFHLLFLIDNFFCILDHCAAFRTVFFLDLIQFFHDHFCHGIIIIQDIFINGNVLHCFCIICLKCLDFQTDQLVQTHIQDRSCLFL